MPPPYSEDLQWRAVWMKEILALQVDEVAAALQCYQEQLNDVSQEF